MKIIVSDLKDCVTELNELIAKYEENLLNLKNIFFKVKEDWFGGMSNSFLDKVEIEDRTVEKNIIELKQILSVYESIIVNYSHLGNKIYFDLRKQEYVNSLFDDYLAIVLEILNIFKSMPVKYYLIIEKYRVYFKEMVENIIYIKEKYNAILNYLSENENKIASKCSKISVEIIKHSDFKM